MATSDQMEKYLNKKPNYVETIDKLFAKSIDQAKKDQKKKSKMLIRDSEGNIIYEFEGGTLDESEDGVMAYTTAHPHAGRGRIGLNKGFKCPHCGKTIDLRR